MPITKEPNGTYTARFYITDAFGKRKQKKKKGFKTLKEAKQYEAEQITQKACSMSMTFASFYELYMNDIKKRVKESTFENKKNLFEKKLLPYFEKMKVENITPVTIRAWQNEMMSQKTKSGALFSQTYLKTLNNQLTAILNYAVKYYGLEYNPCNKAGSMGRKHAEEMKIWSIEEFERVAESAKEKPVTLLALKLLFWTGMRIGEMLALTIGDINFSKNIISINKSYQRLKSVDLITEPKTPKSRRQIEVTSTIIEELRNYINSLYCPSEKTRLFPFTKSLFEKDIKTFATKAGVKIIRIHDLRHSHASLLLHKGLDIATISKRLGHENIETTFKTYAHIYDPNSQRMIEFLEELHTKK